jgi:hypothetical protein
MANTYSLIEAKTLSSATATVTFAAIPATYTDIHLRICGRSSQAVDSWQQIYINLNGSTTDYSTKALIGYNSGTQAFGNNSPYINAIWGVSGSASLANTFGNIDIYFPNYAGSNLKSVISNFAGETNASDGALGGISGHVWANSSAISSFAITNSSGENFLTNSTFYLYGIKNS